MSWRQPCSVIAMISTTGSEGRGPDAADAPTHLATRETDVLVGNRGDLSWPQRFQERARPLEVELWIARFDAQKKAVPARERESRDVEDRVIRLREAIERQHAQDRRKR